MGVRSLRHVSKVNSTIVTRPFCSTVRRRLTFYGGTWIDMKLTKWFLLKGSLLKVLMGFRAASTDVRRIGLSVLVQRLQTCA